MKEPENILICRRLADHCLDWLRKALLVIVKSDYLIEDGRITFRLSLEGKENEKQNSIIAIVAFLEGASANFKAASFSVCVIYNIDTNWEYLTLGNK